MNERQIARVSRAICWEAGASVSPVCVMCEDGKCQMEAQFRKEAITAIKAVKGF